MRSAKRIDLSDDERATLESWSRGRSTPARLVLRAKIVLAAASGDRNDAIAARLATAKTTVVRWRKRFASGRVAGIERDAPRAGRKSTIATATVETLLRKTTHETPAAATHWSTRTMAEAVGVSRSTVSRIWRAHGLKPHLVKTFKLSNDPQFVEKLRDVVGLYLHPPDYALVLSCDEKSQIQALDRTQKSLPMVPGRAGTLTHDYQRNGTTTLFAAIDVAAGRVIGTCQPRHRHQEWIRFLKRIDAATPAGLDLHLIVDNYATHKHPAVGRWLKRHRRFHVHFIPTSSSFHPDEQFVAERGRAVVPRDHREADSAGHLQERHAIDRGHRVVHRHAQRDWHRLHLDGDGRHHSGQSRTCPSDSR